MDGQEGMGQGRQLAREKGRVEKYYRQTLPTQPTMKEYCYLLQESPLI